MRSSRGEDRDGALSTIGKNMFLIIIFAVCLLLSASATLCKERPAQQAGATHSTGEAETFATDTGQALRIYNQIIAAVVLIGGVIFGTYCLRTSNKKRTDRQRGSRTVKEGK
jgi:hypothetical protein